MATDLPAFDSVWIDALVQLRRLTPFQAQVLESSEPKRLRIGPCVLVERLGYGINSSTYLARTIGKNHLRVIKVVPTADESLSETYSRAQALLLQSSKFAHPLIVTPHACERIDQSLVFVSRYVPGRTLTEYLVRRGRYPSRIVWQIGRQLADGLQKLHSAGLAHGDIRPSQVRLLPDGAAVLVDAGVSAVLEPELTPHSHLKPECYDCVAPELIGTGLTPNSTSDLYSLGCLLWQLLAGRPPFPGGDPLQKLASHQTKRIRDVRDFAPDTPAPLAEMILRLTSPNVGDRPPTAAAVLKAWGIPRRSGRLQLQNFVRSFQYPVETSFRVTSLANSPVTWLMALVFCLSGLTFGLTHDGTRTHLLQIWAKLPLAVATISAPSSDGGARSAQPVSSQSNAEPKTHQVEEQQLQRLPAPDAQGVIELTGRGPYAAGKISQVGTLEIRGVKGVPAEIVVADEPLFLNAARVILNGVLVRHAPQMSGQNAKLKSLVRTESLELEVRNSQFLSSQNRDNDGHASLSNKHGSMPSAISWRVTEASSPQSGYGVFENLVFYGESPAIELSSAARQLTVRNVLRLGAGSLVSLSGPLANALDLKFQLDHVTCRQSGAVLSWIIANQEPVKQKVRIEAKDCVFDIPREKGGLLEFTGSSHVSQWASRVQFLGDVCLVSQDSEIAVQSNPESRERVSLDSSELELEGITQGRFRFLGEFGLLPMNSGIKNDYDGIRSANGVPGIIAQALPGTPRGMNSVASRPTARRNAKRVTEVR